MAVEQDRIAAFNEWEKSSGRKLVGLRGNSRDRLDWMLISTFAATGIGRSAFVLAAVDVVGSMDEQELANFTALAKSHEAELDISAPWGKGT